MTLAQWSNLLVYAAMAMYSLALISFAAAFAATRPGAVQATSRVRRPDADLAPVAQAVGAAPSLGRGGDGPGIDAGGADPAIDTDPGNGTVAGSPTADAAARARASARANSAQLEAQMAAEARRGRLVGRRGGSPGAAEELPPGRRAANIAMSLTWLAFGLLVAGLVLRGLWAGRVPWGNMYEYSLSSAAAITGVFLIVSLRRDVRWLGLLVTMASLLSLGVAVLLLYNDSPQLVPALKSYWLTIHVAAAIISGGAFTVGAAATVLYLVADRAVRKPGARVSQAIAQRIPDAQTLDTLAYKVNAFVFPLWTFAVVAGAIWAEDAWGRYWGWDPKETWAFITWLVYAAYLHARATAGWKGRKAAIVGLVGFACFLINYFGVNLFASGLHSYAGV